MKMDIGLGEAVASIGKVADSLLTSDKERGEIELNRLGLILNDKLQVINAGVEALKQQVNVILAEAKGESWLQRNWRPLLMIWFAGLIGAHWMGFTAPNLTEAERLKLLEIVQIGIGGYVVGRSVEKGIKIWKENEVTKTQVENAKYHGATYGYFDTPSIGNPPRM